MKPVSDSSYILGALALGVLTAFVAPFASLVPKTSRAERYDAKMREAAWWAPGWRGDGKVARPARERR